MKRDIPYWPLLWLVFICTALVSRPLIPIDETRYLSVAWEMFTHKQFMVPHLNGEPYSHKPPLFFWLIHLVWMLTGVKEIPARLVGPLFGFADILLTIRMATMLWPEQKEIARNVPYFLLGMMSWTILSSVTMFDTLLTFFVLLGYCFMLAAVRSISLLPWLGMGIAGGLGILAKGPIALLYLLPPLFAAPWWSPVELARQRWYCCSIAAILLSAAIALSWAVPAALAGGEKYGYFILFEQTTGRIGQTFMHHKPFYWYLLLLPAILFPWSIWPPLWRGRRERLRDAGLRFSLAVIIPVFLFLSAISGKRVHYLLPMLPLIALYFARLSSSQSMVRKLDRLVLLLIILVLSLAVFMAQYLPLPPKINSFFLDLSPFFPLALAACTIFLLSEKNRSSGTAIKKMAVTCIGLLVVVHVFCSVKMHKLYDLEIMAGQIHRLQENGRQVAVFPDYLSSQFHFAGHLTQPVIAPKSTRLLLEWARHNRDQYCLLFVRKDFTGMANKDVMIQRFSGGWLYLLPAADFLAKDQSSAFADEQEE